MTPRDVLLAAVRYQGPPYVPWHLEFTAGPRARLRDHFGSDDLDRAVHNHAFTFRPPTRSFQEVEPGMFLDRYGTLWDRTIDKDIGCPCRLALPEPSLRGFVFPRCAGGEEATRRELASRPGVATRLSLGFALFERAWGLRGMENLLMDMVERPAFAHEMLDAIVEHDLDILEWARPFRPDIIHLGDDWGQQHGLIMGPPLWRRFLKPRLARLYRRAAEMDAVVSIHTCGDVREILDDLVEIGVQLFNPFQPEVMDVEAVKRRYHGRLAFHGGMSIQRVLPFGTPDQVRAETRRLIERLGAGGGYVFAPAHAVPADVPLVNILAFLDVLRAQPGYATPGRSPV